jgi:hypothetical protein
MPASKKRRKRRNNNPPRTAEEFFAKSKRFQERWIRVTRAVSKMKSDDTSLRRASHEYGLDPRFVARSARSALRKRRNGRYAARAVDTLLRVVVIPTEQGLTEVPTRDSRQATELSRYSQAVQTYLETGDSAALQQFAGKDVLDIKGKRILLMTDPAQLNRFGGAGLSYESFYARSA